MQEWGPLAVKDNLTKNSTGWSPHAMTWFMSSIPIILHPNVAQVWRFPELLTMLKYWPSIFEYVAIWTYVICPMCEVPSLGSSIWTLGPMLVALFWKVVETLGAVTQLVGVPRDKSGRFYLLLVPVWILCFLSSAITWPVTSSSHSHRLSYAHSRGGLKPEAMSWRSQHSLEQLLPGITIETWKIFHVLSLPVTNPPTSIINKENVPQTCIQANPNPTEAFSHDIPYFLLALACVKVTKN